jgi:rare lipoprotein A
MKISLPALSLSLLLLLSCARTPHIIPPPTYNKGQVIEGIASWYGKEYHGKPTASGEIYNMYAQTAAHRTLPLGTVVQVTNKKNGKSVVVRINDRGPFIKGREIDLSYGAAKRINMVNDGLAPVQIVILELPGRDLTTVAGDYTLQVGAFIVEANARRLLKQLKQKYPWVYIVTRETWRAKYYRVRVGRFETRQSAEAFASKLRGKGYEVFLTRYDK